MYLDVCVPCINFKVQASEHPKVLPGVLSHEGARFPNGSLQGINPKLLPVNHPKVLPGMLSQGSAIFL